MAVDTAQKRFSMLNAGWLPPVILFEPDGTVDADDRAHLLNIYGGNALSGVTAPVFSGTISDISVDQDSGVHQYNYSSYFTGATSYSISPAVETGWNFNTSTAVLTIDTDDADAFGPYTITGTNAGGSDASNAFSVTVSETAFTGGFWFAFEQEIAKRDREREKRRKREEKAKEIQDELDRQIALELRSQEAEEARLAELNRLKELARRHRVTINNLPEQVSEAATQAIINPTFSKMEKLERLLKREREEELFLLEALQFVINQ